MKPVVRFAPSPTGKLHVGNIRIMLANWLFSRQQGGTFILRMDDTDTERSTAEFENCILRDLAWLGVDHDQFYRQSDRLHIYENAIETLKGNGSLYPCYETREELDMKRKIQLSRGLPPQYDRAALRLTDQEKADFEAQGRLPHWRLKLTDDVIAWNDIVHGPLSFEGNQLSDPVLLREDGRPIYTLSSVVDDIDLGITHIIRGDDHIANTAVQLQLVKALGHDPAQFTYAHLPLLTGEDGSGLSKRFGSFSIESLKHEGFLPIAITSLLATLGTRRNIHLGENLETLIKTFDIHSMNKSSARFSMSDLKSLNKQAIQSLSLAEAAQYISRSISEEFWLVIRDNIETFSEIETWWQSVYGELSPAVEDTAYIQEALDTLPQAPWTEETWTIWTSILKEKTQRKGKSLFMPLRFVLTGQEHGPEMKKMLPLLGYETVEKRLKDSLAHSQQVGGYA